MRRQFALCLGYVSAYSATFWLLCLFCCGMFLLLGRGVGSVLLPPLLVLPLTCCALALSYPIAFAVTFLLCLFHALLFNLALLSSATIMLHSVESEDTVLKHQPIALPPA
jgi:hypothetical protein